MFKLVFLLTLLLPVLTFSEEKPKRKIHFYITVDWEGVDFKSGILDPADLARVQAFRRKYPQYPMVHYLNAAYYTNGELSPQEVTKRTNSVLLDIDELGLHFHPWENLVDAAGVDFIEGPTYFDQETSPPEGKGSPLYPKGHRGGDVPTWAYPEEDLKKLLQFSVDKLAEHGYTDLKGFRAGGWQTDPKVLKVLKEIGFETESSPVPSEKVSNLYPNTTLAKNVSELWAGTTNLSHPYIDDQTGMLMMPNNAGLADYVDADEFLETLEKNLDNIEGDLHIVYGFHLETAVEYMDRLDESISRMEALAQKRGIELVPTTYKKVTPMLRIQNSSNSCFQLMRSLLQF